MSDIPLASDRRVRGPRPIKVDMTPLVDLAFLLLSFFILTTGIRRAQALELLFPQGPGGKAPDVMTVLLKGQDGIYCYSGPYRPDSTHLRRLGLDQVHALLATADTGDRGPAWVIKPHATAKYGAVIDLMDEITAAGITRYAIQDSLSTEEQLALEALR